MRKSVIGCLVATLTATTTFVAGEAADKDESKLKAIKPAQVDLGRPVDFKKDIAPILQANCVSCHNVAIDESNLSLEDVKSIKKGGKRGPAVVPKQPDKSLLYQVASRAKAPAMPPLPNEVDARALTPKELGLIRQWILEGAGTGSAGSGAAIAWAPVPSHLNAIYSVAVSPWARYAVAGRANQIYIYDLATGQEAGRLSDPALDPIEYEGKPMYPDGAAHRDFVHSLQFSPDGNLLASGGYRVVKLWQRQVGTQQFKVSPGNAVHAVAISADGQWIALGTADNTVHVVDRKSGKITKKLTGHSGAVTGIDFSADGTKLVSSSADKTVRVWDIAKGNEMRKITSPAAVNDVAFNKDATQIITADADNLLRIWPTKKPNPEDKEDKQDDKSDGGKKDSDTKDDGKQNDKKKPAEEKPLRELKGHSKPVTTVALLLPDGEQVVSGSEDGTVRLWNLSNGQSTRSMNHGSPVTNVAVRADGELVASVSSNGTGKIWQTNNGQQAAELKGSLKSTQQLAWLLEDQAVAKQQVDDRKKDLDAAEKNLKDREKSLKTAKEAKEKADKALAEAEKKAKPLNEALAKAKAELAKKPDDKDLQKKVQDAQKKAQKPNDELEKAKKAQESADRAWKLAEKSVNRAKKRLESSKQAHAAAEERQKKADAEVKQAQDGMKNGDVKPLQAVAFSADGQRVFTADDAGQIRFWSVKGRPLDVFDAHQGSIQAIAVGPEGTIVTGSADKTAVAWNGRATWKLVARLGAADEAPLDLSKSPFVSRVLSLDFSRDGKLLATGGGDPSRSGELLIWDVEKRSVVREIEDAHSDTILGLQFNWDASQILSGGADKFAKIHDVKTGEPIRTFEGHTHHVMDVAWQADGSTVVTAGADNVIKIWNAKTGEQRRTVKGYNKQITSVQFIGVGSNIVACSGDQRVSFHRTNNGQRYRNFGGPNDFVYAAAAARNASAVVSNVNNEANVVVAGGEDGVLRVWNGNSQTIKNFEPPEPPGEGKTQASVKAEQ